MHMIKFSELEVRNEINIISHKEILTRIGNLVILYMFLPYCSCICHVLNYVEYQFASFQKFKIVTFHILYLRIILYFALI